MVVNLVTVGAVVCVCVAVVLLDVVCLLLLCRLCLLLLLWFVCVGVRIIVFIGCFWLIVWVFMIWLDGWLIVCLRVRAMVCVCLIGCLCD